MKTLRYIAVSFFCSMLLLSTTTVSAQTGTINNQSGYKTIYDMLKDIPGLEVKTNNGRGSSVIVRGISTFTGSSTPLFVLDGSIYSGDISNLNPSDIAGITVMKDAASTGAYGSAGANGVIQITTKKGTTSNNNASVSNHAESAYTYFIDHKTPLKVYDMNDAVIIEGVIQRQKGDSLVFTKKRKDFLIAISAIKRVEMIPQN